MRREAADKSVRIDTGEVGEREMLRPFWNIKLTAGLGLAVLMSVGIYLLISSRMGYLGFPLDDAWIHQTYARSLALQGEWAFIPGQPSAGSTAPLWSALLGLGYGLRVNPLGWAYLLGGLSLLGLALAGEAWLRVSLPNRRSLIPWAGLFLVGEWHFAWAAVSGMETLLMAALILLVMIWVAHAAGPGDLPQTRSGPAVEGTSGWGVTGLLIGLSVWIRPDGVTLLGPAILALVMTRATWRSRLNCLVWLLGGVVLLLIPYLLFNLAVSGSILPNTFYAKQAEYAIQRQLPIWRRFLDEVTLPLIGSGVFLLPGFAFFTWKSWQTKNWPVVGAVIWFLGYALLYALRLPVIYQYGRYFMPAMPVYFGVGLAGTLVLLARMRANRLGWLLARVGVLSGVIVWLAFYGLGAGRYAQNVAFIEQQMVAAARWVAANTPPDAIVAAHDIGAMGYFGQRRLLDLAGLVSPEVIPFIRDEDRLARWLDSRQADYLVVLTGWYDHLADGKTSLWPSAVNSSQPAAGGEIRIYRWRP